MKQNAKLSNSLKPYSISLANFLLCIYLAVLGVLCIYDIEL